MKSLYTIRKHREFFPRYLPSGNEFILLDMTALACPLIFNRKSQKLEEGMRTNYILVNNRCPLGVIKK